MEKEEWKSIIIAIILMSVLLMFNYNILSFNIFYLIIPILIIGLFVITQKKVANYIDVSIQIKNWEMSRWWISTWAELKKPVSMGIILPLLLGFLSGGMIKMFSLLQFNATALPSKSVKKYGSRRISGIMEWDDALIGFYSIISVGLLAIVASFLNYSFFPFAELAKFSFYFIVWNLLPLSVLAGSKILFGSRPLYVFTLVLLIITFLILLFNGVWPGLRIF